MTIRQVTPLAPEASVVGVDIGGTKTHLRLRDGSGQRDLLVSTSDWRCREWQRDAHALLELVARLADGAPLAAIGVGAHGCDDKDECQAFEDALTAAGHLPIRVVNDAELMPAAFGLERQIGVVAGTGSIAVCRTIDGEMLVAGGWGWIIGDEGSAASLVREAARAVALHLDRGGTENEPLVRHLFASLEIPSAARIGSRLGSLGSAKDVGGHASLVFDAANEGSMLADAVIHEGGTALADLVARLRLRGAQATSVVAGGSVIASQPRLWDAFQAGVEAICGVELSLFLHQGPPVEGAIVLADRLAAERAMSPLTSNFGKVTDMSYRPTVARQPESLADTLEAARAELKGLDLSPLASGVVAVTGIGASYAAAVVVAAEMQRRGRRAFAVRSGEMMAGNDIADTVLALSHRGRSVETVEAVQKLPKAKSLAVTNNPESPLAKAATYHLRLNNGSDATPSSTGYTATLLAAGLANDAIHGSGGADWDALPGLAREVQQRAAEKMPRLAELFRERRAIDCVGAGASIGTADGASLLIREAARVPASGYETRHYLHGPMESMDASNRRRPVRRRPRVGPGEEPGCDRLSRAAGHQQH